MGTKCEEGCKLEVERSSLKIVYTCRDCMVGGGHIANADRKSEVMMGEEVGKTRERNRWERHVGHRKETR